MISQRELLKNGANFTSTLRYDSKDLSIIGHGFVKCGNVRISGLCWLFGVILRISATCWDIPPLSVSLVRSGEGCIPIFGIFHFATLYITLCSARWLFHLGFLLYLVFLSTFSTYIWTFYARYQIINIYQQSTKWFLNWIVKRMYIFSRQYSVPDKVTTQVFFPKSCDHLVPLDKAKPPLNIATTSPAFTRWFLSDPSPIILVTQPSQ